MFEFLLSDQNFLFSCALCLMLLLALVEGVGALVGISLGNLIDQLLPVDLDIDADAGVELANPANGVTALLGWLCFAKLPFLVWLILALTSFSVSGYVVNATAQNLFGTLLPLYISLPVAIVAMLWLTRMIGQPLARLLPKNESSAISSRSFVGKSARITIGTARRELPAEAVLVDDFGQKHYILVAPEDDSVLPAGTEVALLEKTKRHFIVKALNSHSSLS
ncbi:hypothetical protein HR45_09060 [Shewanella mangrovi]|uniref:Inner membrane protein YqiJ n=1 Tax=Shewanella mangrovi TaxID=1515746 RepID=A0A094JE87_9GAMM|nr:YqiJ family protein [Shewanella mangrovi]KFZ37567.1 hypothetical protein HR45_09060 [Shewanella mangrovi]